MWGVVIHNFDLKTRCGLVGAVSCRIPPEITLVGSGEQWFLLVEVVSRDLCRGTGVVRSPVFGSCDVRVPQADIISLW